MNAKERVAQNQNFIMLLLLLNKKKYKTKGTDCTSVKEENIHRNPTLYQ